jgi:thiamine pyrophosphokinase
MPAVIVCNGNISDYKYYNKYLEKADFVICVDGGAKHIRKFGIKPDLLLGDFDSICKEDFNFFRDEGVEIAQFPREKDMTDTELAVELAITRGFASIIIIGGLGTRMDHSMANIFILRKILNMGAYGLIADEYNEIIIIKEKIQIHREKDIKVTLLPITDRVEGVTTKGLYYPLKDATLEMGSSLGVSNEFDCETAEVTIKSGLLIVIKSRD